MQIIANFLFLSTTYMSFAIGLALIFGVMRVVNYAHGEFYMLGGYVLLATTSLLRNHVPNAVAFSIALVVAALLVSLLGYLLQAAVVRKLTHAPFMIFMATFAISYIIQVLVLNLIGPLGYSIPQMFPGVIWLGDVVLPLQRVVTSVLAIAVMLCLWVFLMRTHAGRAVRAAAQNRTGAVLQGISIERVGVFTMMIGAALAAVSGVLSASVVGVHPFMGGEAIWRAFLLIIVGGIGSIPGAVLASFLFGALDTALPAIGLGRLVAMTDALIMLAILSFRPNGLLGVKE